MRSNHPSVPNRPSVPSTPAASTTPSGPVRSGRAGRNRRLRRLLAATAVGALVAGVGVSAAQADATASYTVYPGNLDEAVAPGTAGKTIEYSIGANASAPTTFSAVTVSYDVSALAGIATLTPQSGTCNTYGTVITCRVAKLDADDWGGPNVGSTPYAGGEQLPLLVVPAAGAPAGASAAVPVTVTSASPAATGTQSDALTITLADGPNLVLPGYTANSTKTVDVAQNAEYSKSFTFTNAGDQAAQGVTLEASIEDNGLSIPELHSNCQYTTGPQEEVACYFPDLVEPGATETVSPAVKVLTADDLMWQGVVFTIVPGYAGISGQGGYTYGTGAAMTLKDSTGAAQVPVSGQTQQNDIARDALFNLTLRETTNAASLSVTGSVDNTPGNSAFPVYAYIANSGDGFAWLGLSDQFQFTGDVVFPAGVTVASAPISWIPVVDGTPQYQQPGQPGYSEYLVEAGIAVPDGGSVPLGTGGWASITLAPGFPGGTATVTLGINGVPASDYTAFGSITTTNGTIPIPAYGE